MIQRSQEFFVQRGIRYRMSEHVKAFTAQEVTAASRVSVKHLVKGVMAGEVR